MDEIINQHKFFSCHLNYLCYMATQFSD